MKVVGTNFTDQAVILWNGSQLSTSMVDANTLVAPVQGGSLAVPGTVHVQVQNSQTGVESQVVPVMIASPGSTAPTLAISTTSLSSGTIGISYSASVNATGGTAPFASSISSGQLPAGLSLSASSGVISGTPTVTGTFTFGVTVNDSGSPQQTTNSTLTLVIAAPKLTIGSTPLPGATVAQVYSGSLNLTGGTAPYTWSISTGQLPTGLSIAPATGIISGTPSAIATSNFAVSVTDSSSPVQTATASTSIVVAPTALTITTSTLLSGTIGAGYSQALQASGGTAPYAWSIASGSLPAGLTLAASGAISGTPTASGTFNITATVHDSGNPAQTKSLSTAVVIAPSGLTITTSTLGSGAVGSGYSQILQASGGTAPYTWSIASGSLPTGLTLAGGGGISGTPTAVGTFNFTATVHDSGNPTQTTSVSTSIVVSPSSLTIAASSLPSGTIGTAYSHALQASGGTAPYLWSIISGSLPAGLTLSGAGAISGTPTASGTFNFTATVHDSGNPNQVGSLSTSIVVASSALTITASSLPSATNGTAYSQTVQANGGTAPYAWSITSGSLPAGLTLSVAGAISGTPTASGTFNFTASVSDSGSPSQTKSLSTSIAVSPGPLTITSSVLVAGTDAAAYAQLLQASGGTPGYTWSITSGSLPGGLTLAATTGTISGTPTASGTFSFTATVSDNGNPAQTKSVATSIVVTPAPGGPTTWYIRTDGGTRYSGNVTNGQCDGKADAAYPGNGINQHCAFNDVRYLWSDNSGVANAWVMAGGDTAIIRGCTALSSQVNPSNPNCRLGYDNPTNGNPPNSWCGYGNPNSQCYNPPIPAGTSGQHTRILGQNYQACNAGGATNPKLYEGNLTQLYGGFGLGWALNLEGTQYVDIQCIEITTHNGACSTLGSPPLGGGCSEGTPYSDFAGTGILTNNTTSNIALQDVYIHGFNSSGLFGPIGGPIAMTRMNVSFNAFAGWDFDDGHDTPDASGSQIIANHVIMEGNGCQEQYPLVNAFPAASCWDTNSEGFGDSWSGQDSALDVFYCNDCQNLYNTKDGFIGPHTWVTTLTIINSASIGNMGQEWKWGGNTVPTTTIFENNLTVGNCNRMSQPLPGAPSTYNQYLSGFCRAAGNVFAFDVGPAGSVLTMANNTMVCTSATCFDISCPVGVSTCAGTYNAYNNIFLGYNDSGTPDWSGQPPGLWYIEEPSIVINSTYNVEYGVRNSDCPTGGTGIVCGDPLLLNEPSQSWVSEATMDCYSLTPGTSCFYPASSSPVIGGGTTYAGLPSTDYFGIPTTNPPVIGAIQP